MGRLALESGQPKHQPRERYVSAVVYHSAFLNSFTVFFPSFVVQCRIPAFAYCSHPQQQPKTCQFPSDDGSNPQKSSLRQCASSQLHVCGVTKGTLGCDLSSGPVQRRSFPYQLGKKTASRFNSHHSEKALPSL